jgi:hypothetical protein
VPPQTFLILENHSFTKIDTKFIELRTRSDILSQAPKREVI